jgi:hypothetical protein
MAKEKLNNLYYGFTNKTAPYTWTEAGNSCPTLKKFFTENFDYNKFYRIRLMRLDPGGYLFPHQDHFDPKDDHLKQINLAINNPEGCGLYFQRAGELPFVPGKMYKMNIYQVHAVYNDSNIPRYHLIIQGEPGKSWGERIVRNYTKYKYGRSI